MIFFDTTKTGRRARRSGLDRVSTRLRESLGPTVREVIWDGILRDARSRKPIALGNGDTFLTTELFSEPERPGFTEFLVSHPGRLAAVFHDAIPLKHPHITWPQSVARHPGYMKLLARFDRVWAVSQASRADLLGLWQWQRVERPPPVEVLVLGADFNAAPRVTARTEPAPATPQLLCLGIIEPRKNQSFLLEVCADLWSAGLAFELHLVGRMNPHFGAPTIARLGAIRRVYPRFLHYHAAADDAGVARLYATTRAVVFPTLAEGCGLPLVESLWMGVPCVCNDLPVLRENAEAGACLLVAPGDHEAWKDALRRILTDQALHGRLAAEATTRPLPTWSEAARSIVSALR